MLGKTGREIKVVFYLIIIGQILVLRWNYSATILSMENEIKFVSIHKIQLPSALCNSYNFFLWRNSLFKTSIFSVDFWPYVSHVRRQVVDYTTSIELTSVRKANHLDIIDFIVLNYRYISVATQILHDAGLMSPEMVPASHPIRVRSTMPWTMWPRGRVSKLTHSVNVVTAMQCSSFRG